MEPTIEPTFLLRFYQLLLLWFAGALAVIAGSGFLAYTWFLAWQCRPTPRRDHKLRTPRRPPAAPGQDKNEVWVMENFLPALKAVK